MNKDKKVLFDVGMHKGEDTDFYLKKGFNVVAFEANLELVQFCESKFSTEIKEGRLVIVQGAIIDSELDTDRSNPNILFYRNKNMSVWGTIDSNWAKRNEKKGTENEIVEVLKIDFKACLEQYGIPYYLKIDIEGMDRVCLKSLLHFQQKPDYISIESEKVSFKELEEELGLFTKNGYDKFKIVNQQNIEHQKEPVNSEEGRYINYEFKAGATGLFGKDLPGEWVGYSYAIQHYKWIFMGYKLFGDNGKITNKFLRKIAFKVLRIFTKQPVPGWYDTHAKHSSVI